MHRQDELTICGGSAMLGIQEYVLLHTYIFFFLQRMEQSYCTSMTMTGLLYGVLQSIQQ